MRRRSVSMPPVRSARRISDPSHRNRIHICHPAAHTTNHSDPFSTFRREWLLVVDAGSPESPESSEDPELVPGFDGVGLSGFGSSGFGLSGFGSSGFGLSGSTGSDAVFVRASSTPLTSDASVFRSLPSLSHRNDSPCPEVIPQTLQNPAIPRLQGDIQKPPSLWNLSSIRKCCRRI